MLNVSVIEDDKKTYMRIQRENSDMEQAYHKKAFSDFFWAENMKSSDDVYMIVVRK